MPVRQHALTVVAPVKPEARAGLARALSEIERDVIHALEGAGSLHFGRFVLLSGPDGPASRLAFESNHDGERSAHVAELAGRLAPFEEVLFGAWEGYDQGRLARFVEERALPASTFYLGHPGLSVPQIRNDDSVRRRLQEILDGADAAGELSGKSAAAIRELLVSRLEPSLRGDRLVVGAVDRGLPAQPQAKLAMYGIVAGVALLALGFVPAALFIERREEATEPPRELVTEDDPRLDAIIAHEDSVTQNGLTHHVPLRPGAFRRITMKLVLWFLEHARSKIAYEGVLGGISSIHFARWVMLDDDTVLFFSNYDGSWEAYLGDFVDKAHHYLTAVWTNTKWFPKTRGLVFQGAAQESTFKQWTRTFQVKNQIWYSAYPHLTVSNILDNARLREGAVGSMTDGEARAWLRLL